MKLILATIALLLAAGVAHAQTCIIANTTTACAAGVPGCVCAEVAAPVVVQAAPPVIVQAPQQCPYGTYWNGGVCIQLAQPPIYIPNPYHPYWGGHGPGR